MSAGESPDFNRMPACRPLTGLPHAVGVSFGLPSVFSLAESAGITRATEQHARVKIRMADFIEADNAVAFNRETHSTVILAPNVMRRSFVQGAHRSSSRQCSHPPHNRTQILILLLHKSLVRVAELLGFDAVRDQFL